MKVFLGRRNQNRLKSRTHTLCQILKLLGVRTLDYTDGVYYFVDSDGKTRIPLSAVEVFETTGPSRRDPYPDELFDECNQAAAELQEAFDSLRDVRRDRRGSDGSAPLTARPRLKLESES